MNTNTNTVYNIDIPPSSILINLSLLSTIYVTSVAFVIQFLQSF